MGCRRRTSAVVACVRCCPQGLACGGLVGPTVPRLRVNLSITCLSNPTRWLGDTLMLMQHERVVVQDLGTDWVVEMEWPEGHTNGPGVLVIRPADPESPRRGLSSTVLREINQEASAQLRRQRASGGRGRRPRDTYHAERINRIRDEAVPGSPRIPGAAVVALRLPQSTAGKPANLLSGSRRTSARDPIRGHLWQARKQDLLTGSDRAQGGQLTPKATKILSGSCPVLRFNSPACRLTPQSQV